MFCRVVPGLGQITARTVVELMHNVQTYRCRRTLIVSLERSFPMVPRDGQTAKSYGRI